MNNYVSKEVAIKLKEAGFDVPVKSFYEAKGTDLTFTDLEWIAHGTDFPAPDFLTVSDWLWNRHKLGMSLYPKATFVALTETDVRQFTKPDHRNEALLFALKQIKK